MAENYHPIQVIPWPVAPPRTPSPVPFAIQAVNLDLSFAAARQAHAILVTTPGDTARDSHARKLLEQHARADCSSLCSRVQYLPRELRDRIYSFLTFEPQTRIICPSHESNRRQTMHSSLSYLTPEAEATNKLKALGICPIMAISTTTPKHIWDAEYVGVTFLQEMIDNWYRTARFHLDIVSESHFMELELEEDQVQIMKRISCLLIRIGDFNGSAGRHITTDEELDQIVAKAQLLKRGSRIEIYYSYIVGGCFPDSSGFRSFKTNSAFVERVLPWLRRIEQSGHSISLDLDGIQYDMGSAVSLPDEWMQLLREKWHKDRIAYEEAIERLNTSSGNFAGTHVPA